MKKWSMPLMIAIVAFLTAMFSANVSAGEQASLSINKSADKTSACLGDTITYTFTISNTGNVTVDNVTLEDYKLWMTPRSIGSLGPGDNITVADNYTVVETDFPGPLVNTATISGTDPDGNPVTDNVTVSVELTYTASIQVTKTADKTSASPHETITYTYTITNTGNASVDNVTLEDDKLGPISLSDTTLAPGDNVTATATYTVDISDLPGPIVNTATVEGIGPTDESVFATSNSVSVSLNKSLMTKAEILKQSGVPGKGIDTAPGLQRPFNPKSKAAEHAGKKNQVYDEEATDDKGKAKLKMKKQLKIRSRAENQLTTMEQLKIRSRAENHP